MKDRERKEAVRRLAFAMFGKRIKGLICSFRGLFLLAWFFFGIFGPYLTDEGYTLGGIF